MLAVGGKLFMPALSLMVRAASCLKSADCFKSSAYLQQSGGPIRNHTAWAQSMPPAASGDVPQPRTFAARCWTAAALTEPQVRNNDSHHYCRRSVLSAS